MELDQKDIKYLNREFNQLDGVLIRMKDYNPCSYSPLTLPQIGDGAREILNRIRAQVGCAVEKD